jgi:hypothetical protein
MTGILQSDYFLVKQQQSWVFCCCLTNIDKTRHIDEQIGLKGVGCSATRMLKVAYIAPIVARFNCFFNSRRLRVLL